MTAREKFNQRARLQRIRRIDQKRKTKSEKRKAKNVESPPEGWMPVREFCKVRGISESGLFQAIQKGKVPSKKCGKFRYVLPADYEAYVLSSREHRIASITKARGSARTKLAKMKEAPDA